MDNFSIFKLLGSLFQFYQDNKANASNGEKEENSPPSFSQANRKTSDEKDLCLKENGLNAYIKSPPLQTKMLFTMQNHQEIVNRVKSNKKQ